MKEYLVKAMYRKDEGKPKPWFNVMLWADGKRTAKTIEEARAAIEKAKKHFNGEAKTETTRAGLIGIESHIDSKTAHGFEIIKTQILVRDVTPWEEVESE